MIHELIDPKKKTNKATAPRNTRAFLDNRLYSDHLSFDPSDSENKEVDSTATFIPPWLRNSLGLSQRQNQSEFGEWFFVRDDTRPPPPSCIPYAISYKYKYAESQLQSQLAVGHTEQKSAKIIHRYKDPTQNEFDGLKGNEEEDGCKNVNNQYDSLPSHCTQDEDAALNTVQECTEPDLMGQGEQQNWQITKKESDSDSSIPNVETRCFEKIDSKVTNSDLMTFAEIGKIREEEKKKLKFIRQKSKMRRRGTSEQKTFDQIRADPDSTADNTKEKNEMSIAKKNVHTVPSEIRQLETKYMLLGKCQGNNTPRLNQLELRLLQNMEENVEAIGDYDMLLEHERNINSRDLIKKSDFLTNNIGEKKIGDLVLQKLNSDLKPDADKDTMLSTDDENDIKRFSEFLSKNKNGEEKRKCLEEVRNYFERKRKTRLSKKRYLEELKSKLSPEADRKENHKDKLKTRELTMILPNRGKRSKFALCDEEVVERAVDETLQKFVELYHFHVSPRVMGNMKRNILQAMQSDSLESGGSKMTLEEDNKLGGKTVRSNTLTAVKPQSPKKDIQCNHPRQLDVPEIIDDETAIYKENKRKTFKTILVNSDEKILNEPQEPDAIGSDRLKRLNKEFENFLRSIQGHLDISTLKIQSIILEKEESKDGNQTKQVQFVYNFRKKALETEKVGQGACEEKSLKEMGVQSNLKKDSTKKSVRIQASDSQEKSGQSTQTEEKNLAVRCTQTEGNQVTFQELKELQSFEINPGLYRMVKSQDAGKFYLYPEQPDMSKGQSYSKSDSSVMKDRKIKKKEALNITNKGRNNERKVILREKERWKIKRNRKIKFLNPYLKINPFKTERENKKKPIKPKVNKDNTNNASSINCLYFRNNQGNTSKSQPPQNKPSARPKEESQPETEEKLGVGDMKDEHLGCVWLWNGEKISPGCDLKTHVENLLKEKLKEMTDLDSLQKNLLLMNELKMEKPEKTSSQKNLFVKGLSLSRTDTKVFQEAESQKNFDINKSNPVFCYTSCSNVNTEKDSRLHLTSENDFLEPTEKSDMKKIEEGNDMKSAMSISQDKIVRNVGTQNSQQKLFSINLAKTKTQSKTTIAVSRRKDGRRTPTVRSLPRKFLNFKKAEEIIRAVEEIKKLEMELKTGRKVNSRESDSIADASSSSFTSKNEAEEPLSLVLGLREGHSKTEETSACTVKSRLRKMMNLVSHEVQTSTLSDFEDINAEERQLPGRHLELIENFLCKVNQKERENLWNDVRKFIKTKIGRDIDDDGAKEVCIEIEQDMPNQESGQMKPAVLARGHYVRNEGDVEVEIDLTLEDLEKILRQRQRRIRRQTQQRKKYKRFISSSSVQSDLNKDEIRRYHKYLNRVAALGQGFTTDIPSGCLKKNKGI